MPVRTLIVLIAIAAVAKNYWRNDTFDMKVLIIFPVILVVFHSWDYFSPDFRERFPKMAKSLNLIWILIGILGIAYAARKVYLAH